MGIIAMGLKPIAILRDLNLRLIDKNQVYDHFNS